MTKDVPEFFDMAGSGLVDVEEGIAADGRPVHIYTFNAVHDDGHHEDGGEAEVSIVPVNDRPDTWDVDVGYHDDAGFAGETTVRVTATPSTAAQAGRHAAAQAWAEMAVDYASEGLY